MNEACERFLEAPEEHSEHLERCSECRAFSGSLNDQLEPEIVLPDPPLAPWEGASHRSWSVVATASLVVLFSVVGLCLGAGISPLVLMGAAGQVPSIPHLFHLLTHFGSAVREAPESFQLEVLAGTIVVNLGLFLLLRKPPKGIHATRR